MKAVVKYALLVAWALLSLGCGEDDESDTNPIKPIEKLTYTFEQGAEGWQGGVSDYPKDWDRERLEFIFEHADLPETINEGGQGMKISGRNISDDLFMFMKRQITGLQPNHKYRVTFLVELASMYPEQSVGIGGSPGASVYLKAGGATIEPAPIEAGTNIGMNIDKGNQAQGGRDMKVLGTVGIPGEAFEYQLIQRDNRQDPIEITTDSNGSLWVIVGTDSGFEGTTTLYYNTVMVELEY
ncbi:hypothetical protein POKO110462_00380 [Pontibacter korlensis]|uniref:Lipoprotein n=1 Tax=Pontibacter korlensis TaxID=400092 RepID=A0A0E3ZFA4_9BACT|nr:hypothetical protein [Pontibacter korlensis]AKD02739.1 hypothetical protein PKOR_05910 [Pontibacter korlensis]